MRPSSILRQIAERIKAVGILAGPPAIPILTQVQGSKKAEREKALADIGMCLYIMVPRISPDLGKQVRLTFAINVYENPDINAIKGPGIPALDMACKVWGALDNWGPAHDNKLAPTDDPELNANVLSGETEEMVTNYFTFGGIENTEASPHVTYSVIFSATEFMVPAKE